MKKINLLAVMFVCALGAGTVWGASLTDTAASMTLDITTTDESSTELIEASKDTETKTEDKTKVTTNNKENTGLATLPNGKAYVGVFTFLNLRDGVWGKILAQMYNNDEVTITDRDGDWYKVTSKYGEGYAHARYIFAEKDKRREGNDVAGQVGIGGRHQASEFYALGDRAYQEGGALTAGSARDEWIKLVGPIVKTTNTFGMKKSLIIAQIINESGWMSSNAKSLSDFNNVLGINTDMGRITPSMQTSRWSKTRDSGNNNVTQWDSNGNIIGTNEAMRHYECIEDCIEDYAEVMSLYHPECKGNNNIEAYRSFLEGYTPNPNQSTTDHYIKIISMFNLEQYDD